MNDGQFDTIPEPLVSLPYRELVETIRAGLVNTRIWHAPDAYYAKTDFVISISDELLRVVPRGSNRYYVVDLLTNELRSQLRRFL